MGFSLFLGHGFFMEIMGQIIIIKKINEPNGSDFSLRFKLKKKKKAPNWHGALFIFLSSNVIPSHYHPPPQQAPWRRRKTTGTSHQEKKTELMTSMMKKYSTLLLLCKITVQVVELIIFSRTLDWLIVCLFVCLN